MSLEFHAPDDVDLVVVRRDDEFLDAIGRRERGFDTIGDLAGDRALTLLAAFATDVDTGLAALLDELAADDSVPAPAGAEAPAPVARAARHAGRAGAAAAVVVAVLSASGVAAAVSGDPLAPVQTVVQTVARAFGHGPDDHAADRAKVEASLRDVDALMRAGRYAEAQALLAQLDQQAAALDGKDRKGLQNQLAALQARLDRAAAAGPKPTPPGRTRSPNPNQPTAHPTPHATRTHQVGPDPSASALPTSPAPTSTRTHPTHTAPGTHAPKGGPAKTGGAKG